MNAEHEIEDLAVKLRAAAFPDARGWEFCLRDTRELWLAAARAAWAWRDETRPEPEPSGK